MKKLLLSITFATLVFCGCAETAEAQPDQRVMTGNYYDYMVIETIDGNQWLLDDTPSDNNPYMVFDSQTQQYISAFEDGEMVQVLFSTNGTPSVLDDEILEVRRI